MGALKFRRNSTTTGRYLMYLHDLISWYYNFIYWCLTGKGDRENIRPPSPARVKRDYWEEDENRQRYSIYKAEEAGSFLQKLVKPVILLFTISVFTTPLWVISALAGYPLPGTLEVSVIGVSSALIYTVSPTHGAEEVSK
jgi:hypothetical protein